MVDTDFKRRTDAARHKFQKDDKANAEAARLAIAKQARDNAANLGQLRRDHAQAAAFARATAENLKDISEAKVASKQAEVDLSIAVLANSKAQYEAAVKLKSANDLDHFYETLIAVKQAYPNGVPKETVYIIGTVFADVVDRNDVKEEWAAFKTSNNASLTVATNVEELHLRKVVGDANYEVARVSSLLQDLLVLRAELVNTGINPLTPPSEYVINGKKATKEAHDEAKKQYNSINGKIVTAIGITRAAIDKITSKIDGPLSLEVAALVMPITILSKQISDFHNDAKNSISNSLATFSAKVQATSDVLNAKLKSINTSSENQFNGGLPNPIFGVNSWVALKDTNPAHPVLYYNQATKISTWKAPKVVSIFDLAYGNPLGGSEAGGFRTIPVSEDQYQKIIAQSPPFKDSDGLIPIIQTGHSPSMQEIKMPDGSVIRPELKYNKKDSLKEEKEYLEEQKRWEDILDTDKRLLIKAKEEAKTDPEITATKIMGAPDFVKEWARLSTPDAGGNIPPQNNSQLLEIVKSLSSSRYGEQINDSLKGINDTIVNFKKFKENEKDQAKIATEAAKANASIIQSIKSIEKTFPLLDEGTKNKAIDAIKPINPATHPLSQVAPTGTSNTANIASSDTPASISTDADTMPVASKVAVPSVSASTSSSATPTSEVIEFEEGQEVDEETGELIQSEGEEVGEPTHYASWKNLPAIFEKNTPYSMTPAPAKGVEMDASKSNLSNSSVPLESDAVLAKANTSTKVPTPLKSIPVPEEASAIKIQNGMDSKDEEDDVATTDSTKKTTAPTAVKKSTSSK